MPTKKVDERAVELARQMEQAAYLVRQTITNEEWLIAEGADYGATLAQFKVWHDEARQRYMDYKASEETRNA